MSNGFQFNPMFASSPGLSGCGCPCGWTPSMGMGYSYGMMPQMGSWSAGPMTWGGTFPGMYTGQGWMYSEGMPSDDQIEDMIYTSIDADPSVPFDSEINIDVAGGVVTLSGTVPNKRVKHAVGDDAWWVPGVWDVNNNLAVTGHAQKPSTRTRAHRPSSGKGSTKGK